MYTNEEGLLARCVIPWQRAYESPVLSTSRALMRYDAGIVHRRGLVRYGSMVLALVACSAFTFVAGAGCSSSATAGGADGGTTGGADSGMTGGADGGTTGATSFAQRCSAPGVVKCVGFDSASEIAGGYGDNSGILPGATTPALDTGVLASGASSLRFTIPSNSGSDTSGTYFTNFSSDLSVQFGANADLYIQWRQRFSPEFVDTQYQGGGGWKQAIVATGDQPSQLYSSCTALEVVTQNSNQLGFPQMYNSCTGSASHGPYDPFAEPFGGLDFKLQNARPSPYCLYSQAGSGHFAPEGNCFGYFPNEWMTFQVHIHTGPRIGDEFNASTVELWVGREGRPSEPVVSYGPYNLSAGSPGDDQKFGKVWLLPYDTGKDSSQAHPVAYTWYDELIISRDKIADPSGETGGGGPVDAGVRGTVDGGVGGTVDGGVSGTSLPGLADSMSRGTFAELVDTNGWNNGTVMLGTNPACGQSDFMTEYANKAVWNPVAKRVQFVGYPHGPEGCGNGTANAGGFVVYDLATNTWSKPTAPGGGGWHSFDHNTLNPATGTHYYRPYNTRDVYALANGATSWTTLPQVPLASTQCCGALQWFPDFGGGRLIMIDGDWGGWSYDSGAGGWTHLFRTNGNDGTGVPQLIMSSTANFSQYSKKGFLVFGGGTLVYKMDGAGTVTTLPAAPFGDLRAGTGSSCCSITTDPVSGDLLVIDGQNRLWQLDPSGPGTWTQKTTVTPPTFFTTIGGAGESLISAPISDYGVVMYVKCDDSSQCRIWLYKN
jgi:hypothetical protein